MESPPYQDLVGVDRDVARAHAALTKWCGEVSNDPEAHGEREPLEPVRHVAGRAAYLAVRCEADSSPGAETPLREALGRWVAHLTLARVGHDLDVKLASAKNDVTAHFVLGEGRKVSWRDAWHRTDVTFDPPPASLVAGGPGEVSLEAPKSGSSRPLGWWHGSDQGSRLLPITQRIEEPSSQHVLSSGRIVPSRHHGVSDGDR
jgi:hypothetical protein